jgi:hypothetical protein
MKALRVRAFLLHCMHAAETQEPVAGRVNILSTFIIQSFMYATKTADRCLHYMPLIFLLT